MSKKNRPAPSEVTARALGPNYTPKPHATPEERAGVSGWAAREHLCASDNDDILRLPRPAVLDTVMTESSAESDTSSPEEEEALQALDAKLNAPRHEEWHVTVEGDPIAWWNFCSGKAGWENYYGRNVVVKPLYIELADRRLQLLSAMSFDPSKTVEGDDKAPTFLQACHHGGFKVVRVKHEVSALRPGDVPLYYELHVKLDGPFRTDRSGASRDLYRENRWYQYRTERSSQPFDAFDYIARFVTQSKPSVMAGFEYEACLLDTNPGLDAGWL